MLSAGRRRRGDSAGCAAQHADTTSVRGGAQMVTLPRRRHEDASHRQARAAARRCRRRTHRARCRNAAALIEWQ